MIRTSRPESLKPERGKVVGARSGGIREQVNHIANLLHSRERLDPYSVRCERITKADPDAHVKAATFGPLTWLSLLGTSMSIALLVLSIVQSDGFALLTTILLSLLSTLVGYGSRWDLTLMKRRSDRTLRPDSVIIKYPNGAFLIIKCDEEIARELYWHPEECKYNVEKTAYRIISLFGTIMLMFGVICLGNSTLALQIAFAAAYMILNAAYWVVAALPPKWHWDLDCYKVKREEYEGGEKNTSFTLALWKAIAITGTSKWLKESQIAPVNDAWKEWARRAGVKAKEGFISSEDGSQEKNGERRHLPHWDADGELTKLLAAYSEDDSTV